MQSPENLTPKPTADGSFTFYSSTFGESFHCREGAKLEAIAKFALPCQLPQLAHSSKSIKLLDICYGLGYNTAAAIETIWTVDPQIRIEILALESDANVPQQAIRHLEDNWEQPTLEILQDLATSGKAKTPYLDARLLVDDARNSMQQVCQMGFVADAIFLDPFSPPKCPQLWTVEFLNLVFSCLSPTARLATYCCAAALRSVMQQAGLSFGSINLKARSPGTIASFSGEEIPPLVQHEREHLQTRAAIPYRDPSLCDDAATIHRRRQQEQAASPLEPTTQWRKRWMQRLPQKPSDRPPKEAIA